MVGENEGRFAEGLCTVVEGLRTGLPDFFADITQWAELFVKSGAKYTEFLTKHHDGFTLWPSATSFNWNSQDVGPRRDVTGEITAATKAAGLHAGVYHSLFEWVNPLFLADQANNFTTRNFVKKTMGELHDLVSRYEPDVIWSDGDWPAGTAQCDSFIAKYCSKVKRTSLSRHCSRSSWDPQDTRCLLLAHGWGAKRPSTPACQQRV